MGMSVSDYIQKVRIEEAKELLRQGKSCGEVACILNYTSQSYFIRQFKKQTGITPKLYRNLLISDSITNTTSPASNIWKKMCPVRTVNYVRNNRISAGHVQTVQYMTSVTV